MRGGEKVLEAFCEMFPHAEVFTLLHNPGSVSATIEKHQIHTSFINRLPGKTKKYPYYLPLFPTAIEQFDLNGFDFILSTSSCVAKGVRTPPGALHISYVHSPMRYVWDMYEDYFGPERAGFLKRLIVPPFATYLRMWDVASSPRVDHFIANSAHVARRIHRCYNREATVIHPLVDTQRFKLSDSSGDYDLIISALVPYKRVDLAVEAYKQSGKKLIIIGSGPEKQSLQNAASANIRFMDWTSDTELEEMLAGCRALIFPGEEDFGIVPVEAQLCGKPVIAYGVGGALETVIGFEGDNLAKATGIFFSKQTVESLQAAIELSESVVWNSEDIHHHALGFGTKRFKKEIADFIEAKAKEFFEKP